MHARAVQADCANDLNFGEDQPQHETHRYHGENDTRYVDPSCPRAPGPGSIEPRHHYVVGPSQNGDGYAENLRLRGGGDLGTVDSAGIGAHQ